MHTELRAHAHILAGLVADGAAQQQDERLTAALVDLAAALWDLAGRGDMADRQPTNRAVTLAQAMTSTDSGAHVAPAEVDVLRTLLGPQAARLRCTDDDRARVVADVIETALARLTYAAAPDRVPVSAEGIAHTLEGHEAECVADPPVRLPWALRCPCDTVHVFRCSRCGANLHTNVKPGGCDHIEPLCRGDLDGWTEINPEPF